MTRSIDDDENDNLITDTDKEAIEQSDIIMTFLSKSMSKENLENILSSLKFICVFEFCREPCG